MAKRGRTVTMHCSQPEGWEKPSASNSIYLPPQIDGIWHKVVFNVGAHMCPCDHSHVGIGIQKSSPFNGIGRCCHRIGMPGTTQHPKLFCKLLENSNTAGRWRTDTAHCSQPEDQGTPSTSTNPWHWKMSVLCTCSHRSAMIIDDQATLFLCKLAQRLQCNFNNDAIYVETCGHSAVMANKLVPLNQLWLNSEYDPHWVPDGFSIGPHLSYFIRKSL